MGDYTFDALRRLKSEVRPTAGQVVDYVYWDRAGRVTSRTVSDTGGAELHEVATVYDGLGRPTVQTAWAPLPQNVRVWVWDSKGSFVGFTPPNRAWAMSDAYQSGRLAYVEDQEGATFYEYDGAGRVKAMIRHDGPLSSFSAANLAAFDFNYGSAEEITSVVYPSGRAAVYSYGTDKERPTSVLFNGSTVLNNATWHTSGAAAGWRWGGSSSRTRTVTRDLLGRITQITDNGSVSGNTINYTYDNDGDLTEERDLGPGTSWLHTSSTVPFPVIRAFGEETDKDMLKAWNDGGTSEWVTYQASGRRAEETDGGNTFSFTYDGSRLERMTSKHSPFIVSPREVAMTYGTAGLVTALDWSNDGVIDTTFGYGALGNVQTRTISGQGTYTDLYDFEMRRTRSTSPSGVVRRWRYTSGRLPLLETSGTTTTMENVLFEGEPVAQHARTSTANQTYYLLTDRMGSVRKIARTNGTSVRRILWDAWGASNGDEVVVDGTATPTPSWAHRYPGQYSEWLTGHVINGWRVYVPEIGQYLQPDPGHREEALLFPGPQAYAYVSAAPLRATDPTGLSQCDDERPSRGECKRLTDELGGCAWAKERLAECAVRSGTPTPEWCDCYQWYVERFCEPFRCCGVGSGP